MSEWKTGADIRQEDLNAARERGRTAYETGKRYVDNPYRLAWKQDDDLVYEWAQGWLDAEREAHR